MHGNKLVDFLRTYGPLASSDSIYDEHAVKAAAEAGVAPIEVASGILNDLIENFQSSDPMNVILTGTAGDGKTWHCRKVFEALGGSLEDWNAGVGQVTMTLPKSGKTLVIIKDLSQFHGDDRKQLEILTGLASALKHTTDKTYLLAANDGQLLRFWRRFEKTEQTARQIETTLRVMLNEDRSSDPDLRLIMRNLSRMDHDDVFSNLVDAVVSHSDWDGCHGCHGVNDCAIRRNLNKLKSGETMRDRLGDMISLAAANDTHLPMRHVLLLIVNIILGVSGRKTSLMTCETSKALAAEGVSYLSNPYDNALGFNLRPGENRNYRAFAIFEGAGIGMETDNQIDRLLLDDQPENLYEAYVANDDVHGAKLFNGFRERYRRGELDDFHEFQTELERQRRRLFFTLPGDYGTMSPWRLTVFRHGGHYLEFWDALNKRQDARTIKSKLVTGLNRSYSGVMCDDADSVWFTSPAANTQSRVGKVLDIKVPVGAARYSIVSFDFDAKGPLGTPRMVVRGRDLEGRPIEEHDVLPPMMFEYLMRVEGGSLPGSFSRQCFEELRQFRMRVVARLTSADILNAKVLDELKTVRLQDGRLTENEIGVTGVL